MKTTVTKKEILQRILEEKKRCKDNLEYCPIDNGRDIFIAGKIIEAYIKKMFEGVFAGNVWLIPRFGYMRIIMTETKNRPKVRPAKTLDHLPNKLAMNPRMIPFTAKIHISSQIMKTHHCRFRAAPVHRKRLTKLLYTTNYGEKLLLCQSIN